MRALQIWLARLRQLMEIVTTMMFATMFVIFIGGVFMRYVVHQPLVWGNELNVILLLWVMFLGGAFVLGHKEHVAFDVAWEAAGPSTRRWMGIVGAVGVGGLFLCALPGTYSYITFLWRERTTVLEWRLDWVYSCFFVFMVAVMARFAVSLKRLLGKNWHSEVE